MVVAVGGKDFQSDTLRETPDKRHFIKLCVLLCALMGNVQVYRLKFNITDILLSASVGLHTNSVLDRQQTKSVQ